MLYEFLTVICFFAGMMILVGSWLGFIVYLLSYTLTLGHWENENYRWPLVLYAASTAISTAIMIYLRTM